MEIEVLEEDWEDLEGTLFFTPGEALDFFNRVKRSVDTLNDDIERTKCLSAPELKAWKRWHSDFKITYAQYKKWWPRMWSSSWDVAKRWEEEVINWRKRYKVLCRKDPSGADPAEPEITTKGVLAQAGNIAMWIAIPIVVYFGYQMFKGFKPSYGERLRTRARSAIQKAKKGLQRR